MTVAQVWKSTKFTIERDQNKVLGTVIFRLSGPFTARDMHGSLSPLALRNTFELEPEAEDAMVHVLDLTEVPYVDSAGLGMLVSHYVRCQSKGIRLFALGVSPRVLQLFEMTKTESLFPMIRSVEEISQL